MQRELQQQIADVYRANHDRIASLVRRLSTERLTSSAAPGTWSVGQVLEHLTRIDELYLRVTEPLIREGTTDAAAPSRSWTPTFLGNLIAGSLRRPRPLRAPKRALPLTTRRDVGEAFLALDGRFTEMLANAGSLDWNAIRLRTPLLPWLPLKMNLGDVFEIRRVHVTRHLGQMERCVAQTA